MNDAEDFPDRRSFIVRSAASIAAGALLAAEPRAPALDPNAPLADFIALSSALIGVSVEKLAAGNGPGGVASEIEAIARKSHEQAFVQLLQAYRAHAHEPAQQIADAVLLRSGADAGFLAKSVMLAWLLGSWYEPPNFETSTVISANAYRQSWAWKIAQTKPMGTTTTGFGRWATAPPPLDSFIGGGG
jgi:hypothetical protein